MPFLIRARQCVITARHAPDALSRDLQRINLAKYCSALPVVFFVMCGPDEKLDNIDNIMEIIIINMVILSIIDNIITIIDNIITIVEQWEYLWEYQHNEK